MDPDEESLPESLPEGLLRDDLPQRHRIAGNAASVERNRTRNPYQRRLSTGLLEDGPAATAPNRGKRCQCGMRIGWKTATERLAKGEYGNELTQVFRICPFWFTCEGVHPADTPQKACTVCFGGILRRRCPSETGKWYTCGIQVVAEMCFCKTPLPRLAALTSLYILVR